MSQSAGPSIEGPEVRTAEHQASGIRANVRWPCRKTANTRHRQPALAGRVTVENAGPGRAWKRTSNQYTGRPPREKAMHSARVVSAPLAAPAAALVLIAV